MDGPTHPISNRRAARVDEPSARMLGVVLALTVTTQLAFRTNATRSHLRDVGSGVGNGRKSLDMQRPPTRILLVASSGGHLLQMLALKPAWQDLDHRWVTLNGADSAYLLADEDVVHAYAPAARNIPNLFRNLRLAWSIIRAYRPEVILSTGAALAVPFFVVGRLYGLRLVYVESFTRVSRPALSGRLVYPLTDAFFVQWPGSAHRSKAVYAGSVA